MSEGDVSRIRDEDVLRRMWQQTEDFSRKKEIRAHMYRLREERLRNLYSAEPGTEGKGCEFSSTQGHVKSFADQSFQSMKSKEVRDAGSPPKEFTYRGQDLKELSNAGWNVESENRTTDDGHTHVKNVQANIEGRYDVEGGKGQFAAFDQHKQAVTEYDDGNTSLRRNESATNTAAHEQVVRKTDDGTQISSTTSSSTSTSKFQKYSSTNEAVPYVKNNDYDLSRQISRDTNRNEDMITRKTTQTSDYEQNLRNDYEHGEVVSRKVDYPDDNTKVVVETRRLPDGTKITSTRREFRAPVVQSSRSEQHSQQIKTENKSSAYTSTQKRSHINESSSKTTRETVDNNSSNIVDTQRVMDDFDFKKNRHVDDVVNKSEEYIESTQHRTNNQKHENNHGIQHQEVVSSYDNENVNQKIKETQVVKDNEERIHNVLRENKREEIIERKISSDQYQTTYQADFTQKKISNDWSPTHQAWASSLRSDTPTRPSTRASSPGSKTFKSSTSSLRSSVSPDKTYRKPPSRGGSPNKIDRYSPTRTFSDRYSSTHSTHSTTDIKANTYSNQERRSTQTKSPTRPSASPDRKHEDRYRSRPSVSPEKRMYSPSDESRNSPDRKPQRHDFNGSQQRASSPDKTRVGVDRSTPTRLSPSPDRNVNQEKGTPSPNHHFRQSPDRSSPDKISPGVFCKTVSPTRPSNSPDLKPGYTTPDSNNDLKHPRDSSPSKSIRSKNIMSPQDAETSVVTDEKTPGYMRSTASSKPKTASNNPTSPLKGDQPEDKFQVKHKSEKSPERKSKINKVHEEHYKFIDEETKMYTRTDEQQSNLTSKTSSTPYPTLVKQSPSPDSPDDIEQTTVGDFNELPSYVVNSSLRNKSTSPDKQQLRRSASPSKRSPSKDRPQSGKPLIDEDHKKKTGKPSPPRESSATKRESHDEPPHFNRPGSRSTSKDTSPKNDFYSTKISEKTTTMSINSESTKTSRRTGSQSPDKFPHRTSSPTKNSPSDNIPVSTQPKSPTNDRTEKSGSPNKSSSRGTSPLKKTPTEDATKPSKQFVKESSPDGKDSLKYDDVHTKFDTVTRTDRNQSDKTTAKSSFPTRKSPDKDIPDFARPESTNKSPQISRNVSRSPSPLKGQIKDSRYDTYVKTEKSDDRTKASQSYDVIESVNKEHHRTSDTNNSNYSPNRDTSPLKYGTYSKPQKIHDSENETPDTRKDVMPKDHNHPKSPSRQLVPSTAPIKITTDSINSVTDKKHTQTTEFLDVERKVEEINKNTITKKRPKQLVTPSTSPTRKPKDLETEPSTGQSSPTTSVSGFVYFSSPRPNNKTITDLDEPIDSDIEDNNKKLDNYSSRSISPSKIPCRSPSPEKRPIKENLPRKSSLKKPSIDNSQVSPTEKPPSSFSVSPMVETKEFQPENKIVPSTKSAPKPKPPLERRETYEERCRKILGMSDETANESTTITMEDTIACKRSRSNSNSPSVSPCCSPAPYEENLHKESETYVKLTSTDFLEKERQDIPEHNVHRDHETKEPQIKTPQMLSKESSPTKMKNIKQKTEIKSEILSETTTYHDDIEKNKQTIVSKNSQESSRQSPEKKPKDQPVNKSPYSTPKSNQVDNNIKNKSFTNNYHTENQPQIIDQLADDNLAARNTQAEAPNITLSEKQTSINSTRKHNLTEHTPIPASNGNKSEPYKQSPKETSPVRSLRYSSPKKSTVKSKTNIETTSTEYNLTQTTEKLPQESFTDVIEESPTRKDLEKITTPSGDMGNTSSISIPKTNDYNTEFISSEKEQEVLDKVNRSLRKLSPDKKNDSPTREKSPVKQTTKDSHNIDKISQTSTVTVQNIEMDIVKTSKENNSDKPQFEKQKDSRVSSKPPSRNVSPIKKNNNTISKPDSPISSSKTRSVSPKKAATPVERLQSPQVQKDSKTRDSIPSHIRKPSPSTTSPTRSDKTLEKVAVDSKKTVNPIKHNSFTKITNKTSAKSGPTSTGYKTIEQDSKQPSTNRGINKENMNPKKDSDTKVIRTSSDITLKTKKIPSQRIKSRPEIQVSDMSTTRPVKQFTTPTKGQKSQSKQSPMNFPTSKPKSATALNTSTEDDDDIIIDVQQAKSSRENSPDRICPTPVGFLEDVGTPRFPDEVNEPDDEFNKRTHHTIHESESIVDDIVEICEDDELFVKRTDVDETDKHRLRNSENSTKFGKKPETPNRPKDSSARFKDIEKRVHSDFDLETVKSDECLLSVSEKVNKFAKGPRDTKDKSPSRNIIDEYDKNTIYQDDYTKLSVNDKAHLFVETAENVKVSKPKPAQKIMRPDFSDIDDSLKSDDCLLSVSDKVHKFVKTAEQFLSESHEVEEKDRRIKEEHDKIIKQIVDYTDEEADVTKSKAENVIPHTYSEQLDEQLKHTTPLPLKNRASTNLKSTDRNTPVKITTLRSSEAVKKAKALFENIASTTQKTKDITHSKTTKLTDIGVIKKSPKTDSTKVHPSVEDDSAILANVDNLKDDQKQSTVIRYQQTIHDNDEKIKSSPAGLRALSPDISRTKSPLQQVTETNTSTKSILSRYPTTERAESPKHVRPNPESSDKPHEKVPGYLRPTKTSQTREEKTAEVTETEVSSRRGSGKFGVELRRTSVERSTVSSERRRSVEHHQPCIEDIYDLDLLEQMLEKVVGYEQRRRIRAQIRVAKKRLETEQVHTTTTTTRTSKLTTRVAKTKSPDRPVNKSPERNAIPSPHKTLSPERQPKSTPQKIITADHQGKTSSQRSSLERIEPKEPTRSVLNGHGKEPSKTLPEKRQRPHSPEKPILRPVPKSPVRQPSPEKKSRPLSPTKTATPKSKANRFNEYATAYMKKIGLESDKVKIAVAKMKKTTEDKNRRVTEHRSVESRQSTSERVSKSASERTSSKDVIEIVNLNGKRSPSPEMKRSPERKTHSPERKVLTPERKPQSPDRNVHTPERKPQSPDRKLQSPERKAQGPERILQNAHPKARSPERKPQSPERTATPEVKRQKSDTVSRKEVIVKTVYDIEKRIPQKQQQEEKPSWVTNRNLKKITSETRTFSAKKIEADKPKYRAPSPSKVISKPIDVITSSYGPGPLDADGRPLFGIKALRNGATNVQVKGTVVRQEFHSRNGSEPEGTVSVTAYSTEPEDLEKLLQSQGERPMRLHGLAAITTTKKFGGDTGTKLTEVHNREERAALDQFTHSDRRVFDSRADSSETRTVRTEQAHRERVQIVDVSDLETREDRHSQRDRLDRSETDAASRRGQKDRIEKKSTLESERREDRRERDRIETKSILESERREEQREKERMEKSEKSERSERHERREDRKTVRQSSVKSLTEKFIKSASETKTERSAYPKAGLILRSTTLKDSVSSDSSAHHGLTRTDSEHSLGSVEDTVVTTSSSERPDGTRTTTTTTTTSRHHSTGKGERSFLDSTTKVTGVQDILTRMKNADIVIEEGDTSADTEARALLNKFLGATVLMAGMQGYVAERPGTGAGGRIAVTDQETVQSSGSGRSGRRAEQLDLEQCWDERELRKLLDECSDYEQRRRLRARIRSLMAEQEACAGAVTAALAAAGEGDGDGEGEQGETREEAEVTTVTSSVRRNSSEKTVSSTTTSTTTIKNSKVIESMVQPAPKPVSPFAKFRQLEKQHSTTNPSSPKTPQSPGSPSQPYFKFTDPALQASAVTIKERLLQWCRDKTRDYENVKLENFSTSWADGLAFCALLHHFLPAAFDYAALEPKNRRHNFTLAFKIADEKAGIYPLLDVDDMVAMRKPDWKCVFTYVQSIYRRFKDEQ